MVARPRLSGTRSSSLIQFRKNGRARPHQQLMAIGETGGLVGVNFATSFLRPHGRRDADTPH